MSIPWAAGGALAWLLTTATICRLLGAAARASTIQSRLFAQELVRRQGERGQQPALAA